MGENASWLMIPVPPLLRGRRGGSRRSRWIVLSLALVLVLAGLPGCGTGARPILKIGLSAPFTGWDEPMGYDVIHAVRLAVRERNQRGGAGGYTIELAALDDRNEPAEAAQQARELAVDPDILGAVGGLDNEAVLAAAAEYHKAALPLIAVAATAARLTDQGFAEIFRLAPRDEALAQATVELAASRLQAKRVAVVQDPAEAGLGTAFQRAAPLGGLTVVYVGEVRRWQLDFGNLVAALGAQQPDVVLFAGRVSEAGPFLAACRAAGLHFAFVGGPAVDDARLGQLAGTVAESVFVLGLAGPATGSSFPRDYASMAGHAPGARAALAYDATGVLLSAIERAAGGGRPTRARVQVELSRTRGYTGVTGEISFDRRGDNTGARPVVYSLSGKDYPGSVVR